jgi:heme/copper-type cytochrome/quinol oxidase subunit 2
MWFFSHKTPQLMTHVWDTLCRFIHYNVIICVVYCGVYYIKMTIWHKAMAHMAFTPYVSKPSRKKPPQDNHCKTNLPKSGFPPSNVQRPHQTHQKPWTLLQMWKLFFIKAM